MKYLFIILPLLFTSCNAYKQTVEYVVQDMVTVEQEVYGFIEETHGDYNLYTSYFDLTDPQVRKVLDIFKYDFNKIIEKMSNDIKRGKSINAINYKRGIENIEKARKLLNSKMIGRPPSEYNFIVGMLVEFSKEVSKSFLLKEYAKIFKEKFSL